MKNENIRQRKDGIFEYRKSIGGKRISFYGKSKAEVKRKYTAYVNSLEPKMVSKDSKVSVKEYASAWLLENKYGYLEDTSFDRLESIIVSQINPAIGDKFVQDIAKRDVLGLINSFAFPKDGSKGLAYSGLKKLRGTLYSIFENAVNEGIIAENPAKGVQLPRESKIEVKTKKQFSLSEAELNAMKEVCLQRMKNGLLRYRNGPVFLLLANTGLRAGEILALEWSDVDFEKGVISVRKIMQYTKDRTGKGKRKAEVKESSKTVSGERFLPINSSIREYLDVIQENNRQIGLETLYVVSTKVGTRETHRNLARGLSVVVKRAGLPDGVTLHTLRHTFGSMLIKNGVDVSVVSKLLGHANINVTYKTYIHVIQESLAKVMDLHSII